MYFVYSSLLTLGFILLLPRFAIDALRNGKYVTGLRQRLGNLPEIQTNGKRVVWLHCVSVGEAQAAQTLVRAIKERYPNLALVISTTTVTGQKIARDIYRDHAKAVFYFPVDWAWTVRRVLRAIQPAAILVMETELWPNLFRESRRCEIPIALINGRISDKSFSRYQLVRPFIRRVLNDLAIATLQTDRDAARVRELGLAKERIIVSGNLKFDTAAAAANDHVADELSLRFGLSNCPLIVAASTHEPEERITLEAFQTVRQTHPQTRLLIAPRHPERFEQVADLLKKSGLSWARRSEPSKPEDKVADIVLLDSIGELRAAFSRALLAFVGGSIAPHGGHSVIEPAADGICTVTGPHMQNFAAVVKALLDEDALVQLPPSDQPAAQLAHTLSGLLSDDRRRADIGKRAQAVCDHHRGATERTLQLLSSILAAPPSNADFELQPSPLHAATAK